MRRCSLANEVCCFGWQISSRWIGGWDHETAAPCAVVMNEESACTRTCRPVDDPG